MTERYIKCKSCSKVYNFNEQHVEFHVNNYHDDKILYCYSCGDHYKEYSKSQLAKNIKQDAKNAWQIKWLVNMQIIIIYM